MKNAISPRLRAPALLAVAALIILVFGGAAHGWSTVVYVLPIPILSVFALYVWGGRDSDSGAAIRRELDERQAYRRLKIQALVGRVLPGRGDCLHRGLDRQGQALALRDPARTDDGVIPGGLADLRRAPPIGRREHREASALSVGGRDVRS